MAKQFYLSDGWGKHLLIEDVITDDPQINGILEVAHRTLEHMLDYIGDDGSVRDFGYNIWEKFNLGEYGIHCGHADDVSEMLFKCEENKKKNKKPDHFAFVTFDNDFVTWYFNEKLQGNVWI